MHSWRRQVIQDEAAIDHIDPTSHRDDVAVRHLDATLLITKRRQIVSTRRHDVMPRRC